MFSNILAYFLQKPHITIFKDLTTLESNSDFTTIQTIVSLKGKKVLHISDLITEAASYINAWIPAIEKLEGEIKWTTTVVDRMQGGYDKLEEKGVITYPLVRVNIDLFKTALENESITKEQFTMINDYINNPDETMRNFLLSHPEFIKKSLEGTGKTLIRAKKCVEEDIYKLGDLAKRLS